MLSLGLVLLATTSLAPSASAAGFASQVLVYGGTPSGVLAAVTAARAGASVTLLEPTKHLGGLMSNGLGWTDIGDKSTLGGFTREWFDRVQRIEGETRGRYAFAPSSAELAFRQMLGTTKVRVVYDAPLRESGGVVKDGARILSVRTVAGNEYRAQTFIDASYTGDLMAQAGVTYRLGREAIAEFGEPLAGARGGRVILGSTAGQTMPYLATPPGPPGSADDRIQASNYRVCFSSDPSRRVPLAAPLGYDRDDFTVIDVYLDSLAVLRKEPASVHWVLSITPLTDRKYDVNDYGAMSTALPGLNWTYPEATYAQRALIDQQHRRYAKGLFHFLAHDSAVAQSVRSQMARFGLCKDEFLDNGHWPRQLYLREGRRMVGQYVLRQSDLQTKRSKTDIIGIASYRIDSHFVSRWADAGRIMAEGTMSAPKLNYAIPYRIMVPNPAEARNLLVPVAASATHVAQSSLRMEPQYMLMGEAAGEAAALTRSRRIVITRSNAGAATCGGLAHARSTAGAVKCGGLTQAGSTATPTSGFVIVGPIDVGKIDVARLQARLKARGAKLTNPS